MCVRDLQERKNTILIDCISRPTGILHNSLDGFDMKFAKAPKSVTFNDSLVVDVRERPRTLQREKGSLFYTREDYRRFRCEYRIFLQSKNQVNTESLIDFSLDTIQYAFSCMNKIVNEITDNILTAGDPNLVANDEELYAVLYQYV